MAEADASLLERLRARDEAAFSELVRREHPAMLRVARGLVASVAVAEEVVQETWVAIIEGLARFEGRSSLRTWIFTILVNRARTRASREGRSIAFAELDGETGPSVSGDRFKPDGHWAQPIERFATRGADERLIDAEAAREVERALAALPPAQRTVVTLRDVEGLDAAEVCNVMEITESNQRVLLHRGRTKVRAALERLYSRK
jgi:RNA polymerase sigma-70 factor (ECF subfamily)